MCGCNKGSKTVVKATEVDASVWGPIYWRAFHIMGERVGASAGAETDAEVAGLMKTIVTLLPDILPCDTCRSHARIYIAAHPVNFTGLTRTGLRDAVRTYFHNFHNNVRIRKSQPLIVSLGDLEGLYGGGVLLTIPQLNVIEKNINTASASRWPWMNAFQRIHQIVGLYR